MVSPCIQSSACEFESGYNPPAQSLHFLPRQGCGGSLLVVIVIISLARSSIVGGKDAQKGSWPWIEWVLTAANCVDPSFIRLGTHSLNEPAVFYRSISLIVSHPQYQKQHLALLHNIALVKMSKKVSFSSLVKPMSLPKPNDNFVSNCFIAGWGDVGNNVELSGNRTLQELKVTIFKWRICKKKFPGLTDNILYAGSMERGKGSCQGYSGGPLVCRSSGEIVQVGIVSFGNTNGCALKGFSGVYTRVKCYMDFIYKTITSDRQASA
uniref:trypsin n=1 Tax=Oncorhynchus mykiss TaxID=8022 RepID=A0A8K9WRK4_ONCMY